MVVNIHGRLKMGVKCPFYVSQIAWQDLGTFREAPQRSQWHPTPVLLPGESQGQGSLVGCHLWGRTESDTTEVTQQQQQRSTFMKCQMEFF